MCGPLIDWNGSGQIDPSDIAITLAAAEEEEMDDEDEREQAMKQLQCEKRFPMTDDTHGQGENQSG